MPTLDAVRNVALHLHFNSSRQKNGGKLEEISFEGPDLEPKHQVIDAAYVEGMLSETVKNQDLSRYIL